MVLELPCKSADNDNFDLLNADRNQEIDEDMERSFMRLTLTDKIGVGTLENGAILIFCKPEELQYLNFFINEKAHDVYLWLQEIEHNGCSYGKQKFNYNQSLPEIYMAISEIVTFGE
jgi:hypothetical protein